MRTSPNMNTKRIKNSQQNKVYEADFDCKYFAVCKERILTINFLISKYLFSIFGINGNWRIQRKRICRHYTHISEVRSYSKYFMRRIIKCANCCCFCNVLIVNRAYMCDTYRMQTLTSYSLNLSFRYLNIFTFHIMC